MVKTKDVSGLSVRCRAAAQPQPKFQWRGGIAAVMKAPLANTLKRHASTALLLRPIACE